MNIDQYCQRQRCKHAELEQFFGILASRGFVSDSRALLFSCIFKNFKTMIRLHQRQRRTDGRTDGRLNDRPVARLDCCLSYGELVARGRRPVSVTSHALNVSVMNSSTLHQSSCLTISVPILALLSPYPLITLISIQNWIKVFSSVELNSTEWISSLLTNIENTCLIRQTFPAQFTVSNSYVF